MNQLGAIVTAVFVLILVGSTLHGCVDNSSEPREPNTRVEDGGENGESSGPRNAPPGY
jgi:hypothetical protein